MYLDSKYINWIDNSKIKLVKEKPFNTQVSCGLSCIKNNAYSF